MEIRSTFTSNPKEILRGYRRSHPVSTLVTWALGLVGVAYGIVSGEPLVVVVSVAYLAYCEWSVRHQLKRHMSGPDTFTLTMTDTEYRMACGDHGTTLPWTRFTNVKRAGECWVMRVGPGKAMAFPASALDEAQTAAFQDLLRAKGLLPPGDLPAA